MPNYCDNVIYLYVPHTDTSMIKKLNKIVANPTKSRLLNTLYPMPKHQPDVNKPNAFFAKGGFGKDQEALYGRDNWYDWSVANWGTKWDFDLYDADVNHDYKPGLSMYTFTGVTAWSPCVQALMNSKYDFKIFYCETGMGFWGYADRNIGDISYNGDEVDIDDYDKFLDYRTAWNDWLKKTDLPSNMFDILDVPAMFGNYEQEDKPQWFDGFNQ